MTNKPADAATVILVRPCADCGGSDIECLLVLKSVRDSFVPGYYVFPGGSIEAQDYHSEVDRVARGLDRKRAAEILSDMAQPGKAIGAWVAAFRELFEETGLLPALRADRTPFSVRTASEADRFERYRRALTVNEMTFAQILDKEQLLLPLDRLHYFSHWITPEPFSLRYDVRFFLTPAPSGQSVSCDGRELTKHLWIRPSSALREYRAGRIDLVLPQLATLEELAVFQTVEQAVLAAGNRRVPAVLTRIETIDGRDVEVMPDGTSYPVRPPSYP